MSHGNLFGSIQRYVEHHKLISMGDTIVLGLSGGPDSVFLLEFLGQLHVAGIIKLIAAHLNHQWRPESSGDAAFCKDICHKREITCVVGVMSDFEPMLKKTGSQEDLGRQARRLFLESVLGDYSADSIALAHHLQDQEETFFIRLIRGTTLTGLTSMAPRRGYYIRPLLETNKTDIIRFLEDKGISYLVDPTNEQPTFLRNRIRTNVLPALTECDERFHTNFLRTLNSLKQTEDFLDDLSYQTFEKLSTVVNAKQLLDNKALLSLHPTLLYRVMLKWLFANKVPFAPESAFLDEIIRFLRSTKSNRHEIAPGWFVVKSHDGITIEHA